MDVRAPDAQKDRACRSRQLLAGSSEAAKGTDGLMEFDERTAAIVVHHDNFPVVLDTLAALQKEGVDPRRTVVIDNTADPAVTSRLEDALPAHVRFRHVENAGYGAAVNVGLDIVTSWGSEYVVVSTHEAMPDPGAVRVLTRRLDDCLDVAVAGPLLATPGGDPRRIWSMGGIVSPYLNEPRHRAAGQPVPEQPRPSPIDSAWLDGAFCVYRIGALDGMRFREEFFLYFEETELHHRIRRNGYRLECVPEAIVEQESGGVPPFYWGRNMVVFQRLHGNRVQRRLSAPAILVRKLARRALRGGDADELRQLTRGLWAALRHERA